MSDLYFFQPIQQIRFTSNKIFRNEKDSMQRTGKIRINIINSAKTLDNHRSPKPNKNQPTLAVAKNFNSIIVSKEVKMNHGP